MFVSNGLFNHESPLSVKRLLQKIIQSLVKIKFGSKEKLVLGNLYSKRDWGMLRITLKHVENIAI